MANNKQTSSRIASTAGKTLGGSSASLLQKSLVESALRQADKSAQNSGKIEHKATQGLENSRSSPVTKALAHSVTSQSNNGRR
jgi:hypothetical protein